MDFNKIREDIKNLKLETLRTDCDNYFEAVIVKEELVRLSERLKVFFGDPAWPSKNRLDFHMEEAVKGFGGIMPGQTLYFNRQGGETVFAMLWPWQDGVRTTVKIISK